MNNSSALILTRTESLLRLYYQFHVSEAIFLLPLTFLFPLLSLTTSSLAHPSCKARDAVPWFYSKKRKLIAATSLVSRILVIQSKQRTIYLLPFPFSSTMKRCPQKLPQHHCIRYDIYVLINQVQLCRVSYHFIRLWNFNAMKMKNAWNWMKAHLSLGTKGTQILFIVIHVDPLFLPANILCFPISTRLSYRRVHFYHTVVRYSKAFLLDVTWLLSMYANICLLYVSRIHVLCCKSPIEQNILQADFWPFVCAI